MTTTDRSTAHRVDPFVDDDDATDCFICGRRTAPGGLYCSDECRSVDGGSNLLSPRSSAAARSGLTHPKHLVLSEKLDELFSQDIPELDLGYTRTFSNRNRATSRSSARKSLSSRDTSSQSSSPVSAPSFEGDDDDDDDDGLLVPVIPHLSDAVPPKSPYSSAALSPRTKGHSVSHDAAPTPPFFALDASRQRHAQSDVTTSPTIRPVLRYSRRAYSTNVRASAHGQLHHPSASSSTSTATTHKRTPSANILDVLPRPRHAPESAPPSAFTSPMLSAYKDHSHYRPGTFQPLTSSSSSKKDKRQSLPLGVHGPSKSSPTHGGSSAVTPYRPERFAAPEHILNKAVAAALPSLEQSRIVTPSHLLGGGHEASLAGSGSTAVLPEAEARVSDASSRRQTPPSSRTPASRRSRPSTATSERSVGGDGGGGGGGAIPAATLSTATIRRPTHSRLEGIAHESNLGRLISPPVRAETRPVPASVESRMSVLDLLEDDEMTSRITRRVSDEARQGGARSEDDPHGTVRDNNARRRLERSRQRDLATTTNGASTRPNDDRRSPRGRAPRLSSTSTRDDRGRSTTTSKSKSRARQAAAQARPEPRYHPTFESSSSGSGVSRSPSRASEGPPARGVRPMSERATSTTVHGVSSSRRRPDGFASSPSPPDPGLREFGRITSAGVRKTTSYVNADVPKVAAVAAAAKTKTKKMTVTPATQPPSAAAHDAGPEPETLSDSPRPVPSEENANANAHVAVSLNRDGGDEDDSERRGRSRNPPRRLGGRHGERSRGTTHSPGARR